SSVPGRMPDANGASRATRSCNAAPNRSSLTSAFFADCSRLCRRRSAKNASGLRWQDPEAELGELFGVEGGGGAGEGVGARLGLGEGDDLTDVVLAGQDGGQAVDAEGEAGVGRGAVAEGVEQEAEAGLSLFGADAEETEDALLQVGSVNTDASRSELPPVEHQVVRQ